MVAGKRYAELQLAERTGAEIRKSLESYTSTYLRFVWTLSATAVVVCYGLWAFERDHHSGSGSRCRWSRSPSRSCGTRSTSTAGWPASPKTSPCVTGCCSCWRWPGSGPWVPPLSSASTRLKALKVGAMRPRLPAVRRSAGRRAFPYDIVVRVSLWISVAMVAALFGWGAWQRRWIADDGLIVLRTVRNLLAGNGPVFNPGERVEANTSTAWTYLMYLGSWVGGPMRMEYVALALALTLSVLGMALLMLGTGRLYAPSLRGRRAIMLPAGALVYIAMPPARDFATSGLENGLVLAYLGLLWWMMVCWSQPLRARADRGVFIGALAFVAGCSVLVRPELALIGGRRTDHDVDRGPQLAPSRADRGGRRLPAGRLPDLPDGLLRAAGAGDRPGQGRRRVTNGRRA